MRRRAPAGRGGIRSFPGGVARVMQPIDYRCGADRWRNRAADSPARRVPIQYAEVLRRRATPAVRAVISSVRSVLADLSAAIRPTGPAPKMARSNVGDGHLGQRSPKSGSSIGSKRTSVLFSLTAFGDVADAGFGHHAGAGFLDVFTAVRETSRISTVELIEKLAIFDLQSSMRANRGCRRLLVEGVQVLDGVIAAVATL